jgi:hypothetical protein
MGAPGQQTTLESVAETLAAWLEGLSPPKSERVVALRVAHFLARERRLRGDSRGCSENANRSQQP